MRQNRVCVMQSNYTQLSGEAQLKQKAFGRPMGNDISARQMLSHRIALSLADLYFLKLRLEFFFFDSNFFFENVCFFNHRSLLQSYHLIYLLQPDFMLSWSHFKLLRTALYISFFNIQNKILELSESCSLHSRIMISEIILQGHVQLQLLYVSRSVLVI